MLVRHGYGVLLLDRRGEGASEGDYNAFGWAGERDLRAALAFLRRQPDVDPARIGGLGLSVGGELLLQTAAHTQALRAVVSEGAGQRSLAEHLDNPEVGRVQRWVTGMLAQTAAVAVLSNSRPPESLADLMPRIAPRPVLLIEAAERQPGRGPQRGLRRSAAAPRPSSGRPPRAGTPARSPPRPPNTSSASWASSTMPCATWSEGELRTRCAAAGPRTGHPCARG